MRSVVTSAVAAGIGHQAALQLDTGLRVGHRCRWRQNHLRFLLKERWLDCTSATVTSTLETLARADKRRSENRMETCTAYYNYTFRLIDFAFNSVRC